MKILEQEFLDEAPPNEELLNFRDSFGEAIKMTNYGSMYSPAFKK